ncbi:MATE family efflux transporter [Candidatus Palauibacter sp.]|uniref:MATE family efflux transporter n=1 Tax=Candidatus Palauibacter sp. TaxID=3101350 RepID=UPI003B0253BD
MEDLTRGSIPRHIVRMAIPIAIGMVFQTLYYLVDVYFVGRIGEAAVAGLTSGGNAWFLVMALTQVLGVGTMALIANASGRQDRADANLIFNQSLGLAALLAGITLVGGYALTDWYMEALAADAETVAEGSLYLRWCLPGLALQFALVSMGSALRGTGIVKPTIFVQVFSVALNAVLAPFMIAGWVTGRPLGVLGAGLSTTISIAVGVLMMLAYFLRLERFVRFDITCIRPRIEVWRRILRVGLPPGGEFALMFVYMAVIYWCIRGFGAEAQAGFGIGSRVMQAVFLPAMAIAFATAPVAGQNVGAGQPDRVRETFRWAVMAGGAIMLTLTLLCQIAPATLVGAFSGDDAVIGVGGEFLRIISWNFVATGFIFTCNGIFQALGNTVPSLVASGMRIATFALPAVWLAGRPWFELHHLWYLSVATVAFQALVSWTLLRRELARKLA